MSSRGHQGELFEGFCVVFRNPFPPQAHEAHQVVGGVADIIVGQAAVPLGCLDEALCYALALPVHLPQSELGPGVPLLGQLPETV
jgi:hypothetical protein